MPYQVLAPLVCLVLAAWSTTNATAQEWTRFRGPNGAGQSDATTIPTSFTPNDFVWKIPLPGVGHSSPVLWGEKLFVTSGDVATGDQIISCVNARSGALLWRRRLPSAAHALHLRNSFASGTPCVDEDHLYISWSNPQSYKLAALDHNREGATVWEIELGPFDSMHGHGMSPIVHQDMVITVNDQLGASFLLAVDRKTGDERWRIPRTNREVSYSTPCVRPTADGRDELIFESGLAGLTGVDPATGLVNWTIELFDKRTVSSPILAGDLVIGACGASAGGNFLVGVRPPAQRGQPPQLVYKIADSSPYVPTSILVGQEVYLWYDGGVVTCIDAANGQVHWRSRSPGTYSGSPVRVGNRIYCVNQEGEMIVVAANREKFDLVARIPLGEASQATPAIALGRMYLRTERSLICIGGD